MKPVEIDKALGSIPEDRTMEVAGVRVRRVRRKKGNSFLSSGFYYEIDGGDLRYSRKAAVNWLIKNGGVE